MNFDKLKAAIISAPINNSKMTDLAVGSVHNIAIETIKGEDFYYLVDVASKKRTPATPNALAALRIVSTDAEAKAVTNTRDARTAAGYKPLQAAVAAEEIKIDGTTKFSVVHNLQILDPVTNEPFYKNDRYNGYPAYLKACQRAARLKDQDRTDAFQEATEALRASGLKADTKKDIPSHLLQMPVFVVTA